MKLTCVLEGIHCSGITDRGAGVHDKAVFQVVGSKGELDRGSVASIGEKFQGAAPGAAQGGGAIRSQGEMLRDVSIY